MKPQAVPLDRFAIKAASDYYFYEGEDLICQQDVGDLVQDESQYEPKFLLLDHLGSTRAELEILRHLVDPGQGPFDLAGLEVGQELVAL